MLAQGSECELTVVFIDIRGFTKISERMPGAEVVALLNHFAAQAFERALTLDPDFPEAARARQEQRDALDGKPLDTDAL